MSAEMHSALAWITLNWWLGIIIVTATIASPVPKRWPGILTAAAVATVMLLMLSLARPI